MRTRKNTVEMSFEAVGFVDTRKQLNMLEALQLPGPAQLLAQLGSLAERLGITQVAKVYITEDDGQGSSDIKVFVVVRLQGTEALKDAASPELSLDLWEALEVLALNVCTAGNFTIHPGDWEKTEEIKID